MLISKLLDQVVYKNAGDGLKKFKQFMNLNKIVIFFLNLLFMITFILISLFLVQKPYVFV